LDDLSNVNCQNVSTILRSQAERWIPQVREAMENTPELTALTDMIEIGGISLNDIFGSEKMNQFQTAATGHLNAITSVENKLRMLLDIVIILCLLACVYQNFTIRQWGSVLANFPQHHAPAYEQAVYQNLLGELRLLVSNFECDIVAVISTIYGSDN